MTINDMINAGITFEGEVEIRKWDSDADEPVVLFKSDTWDFDVDASYMDEEVVYMFAYRDTDNYSTVLCFELAN